MERIKMSRQERAKQFSAFDALKGLQDMLRVKEYEHERLEKGDLFEEQIEKISKTLLEIKENDIVEVLYYIDEHFFKEKGKALIKFNDHQIFLNEKEINFEDISDITIVQE